MRDDKIMFDRHMSIRECALKSLREYREYYNGVFTSANVLFTWDELDEVINALTETDAIQNAYKLGYEQGTKDTKKSIAKSFETFKKSME